MFDHKHLIRSLTYMLSGTGVTLAIDMVITFTLAYFLIPEDLGKWMAATAFVNLFTFFFDFGLKDSILRTAAGDESGFKEGLNVAIGNALIIRTVVIIPVTFLVLILAPILYPDADAGTMYVIKCYVFVTIFDSFAKVFGIARKALGQFKLMAFLNAMNRILRLIVIFTVLKLTADLILLVNVLLAFNLFRFFISFATTVRLLKLKFDIKQVNPMVKESFQYGLFDYLGDALSEIDRVMLNSFLGPVSVANYSVPSKFNRLTKTISETIMQVFLPSLHELYAVSRSKFQALTKKLSRFYGILGMFAFLFIYYCAELVLLKLFGQKYASSLTVVQLFAFISLMWFLERTPGTVLAVQAAHKQRLFVQTLAVVLNVVLNFMFIPQWGIAGAVYATIASYFLKLTVINYYSREYIEGWRILAITLIPILFVCFLKIPFYFAIPGYLLFLFITKSVSVNELKMILKSL